MVTQLVRWDVDECDFRISANAQCEFQVMEHPESLVLKPCLFQQGSAEHHAVGEDDGIEEICLIDVPEVNRGFRPSLEPCIVQDAA